MSDDPIGREGRSVRLREATLEQFPVERVDASTDVDNVAKQRHWTRPDSPGKA